jgi:hypothetical protein
MKLKQMLRQQLVRRQLEYMRVPSIIFRGPRSAKMH